MAKAAKKDDDNIVELKRNGPAEDAVKAVQLGKIKRAKAEFETANGNYRNVLKHVEAKGIDLAAAKDAIAIQKSGKVADKVAYLTSLFEYLMILGCPIDKKQLDMFRVEESRTPSLDKAKQHGRYVGIMGLGMDQNPYAIDSDQGQAWITAFHEGTKEREMVLSMEPGGSELIKPGEEDDVFDEEDEFDAADPGRRDEE